MTTTENIEKQNPQEKSLGIKIWENLALFCLALTIFGQVTIGASFILGQGVWFVANVITLTRDFILHRPAQDKIKNAALTAITAGIITAWLLGWY